MLFAILEPKVQFDMEGLENGIVKANKGDNRVISCVAVGKYIFSVPYINVFTMIHFSEFSSDRSRDETSN